ncbi:hypothetical protein [Actinokineospora xionganensis]|uniref:Uncharacterized protein n=1 Tax=Actinokineospora xionganensis TaxID=2684470 RepID=A0ABR7LCD3_9PSEU|nr:hypothetical protein [Actinokineospora xionganensis]MBC6450309.1 hypothetical protein [Actinokineospora xionganensis]
MITTPEQADLAANLVAPARKMDPIPARLRHHASGLVVGWASADQADALAEVLEETARQVRLHRPTPVLHAR